MTIYQIKPKVHLLKKFHKIYREQIISDSISIFVKTNQDMEVSITIEKQNYKIEQINSQS